MRRSAQGHWERPKGNERAVAVGIAALALMSSAEKANRWGRDRGARVPAERARAALVELIAERGYSRLELADLLAHLDVEEAAFKSAYPSLDACFTDVWQRFTEEFVGRAFVAFSAQETWREGIRAQAWEFYRFLSEDPLRARICMVEINYGGELAQATRDRFMDAYVELVHLGRLEAGREDVPRARAEAVVGAIWEQVAAAVNAGDFKTLIEAVPQMLYLLVQPYLGIEAADEELRRGPNDIARYLRGEI